MFNMTQQYNQKRWLEVLEKTTSADAPAKYDLEKKCLLWTGGKSKNGYGLCRYRGKTTGPHRISWMIANRVEEVPKTNGIVSHVRHLCNQPLCVEPTHLKIGSAKDNGKDKLTNPNIRGDFHSCAKITADLAEQIKKSKLIHGSQKARAERFNVPLHIIKNIDSGTTWAHIPDAKGNVDRTKADKRNECDQIRRAKKNIKDWTDEEWKRAENKLWNNPNYVNRLSKTVHGLEISCLEWKSKRAYPSISVNGLRMNAHLLACIIGNNRVRPEVLQASHKCGNSKCVEKTHLHFQSSSHNIKDRHKHGTMKSKLSEKQVLEMREKYSKGGVSCAELAREFSIHERTVSKIVTRHCWTHV